MSKMSKAIAVLGVVAGLGVAALPLSSYAEGGGVPTGVATKSTSVKIETKVDNAISIATNADTTGIGGDGAAGVIDLGELMPGSATKDMDKSLQVTVGINDSSKKVNLYINALGDTNAMVGKTPGATIPAMTTGDTLDGSKSGWGYAYSATEFAAETTPTYKPVPVAAQAEKVNTGNLTFTDNTTAPANGVTRDFANTSYFKFKAAADTNQAPDTYTATVVFTAAVANG